ncbi:MAG: amidohydrolase family protein [Candidatus Bathyarchaeia archaeon]
MRSTHVKISEVIANMHVVDTHEHTYPQELVASRNPSIVDIFEGAYIFWTAKPPAKRNDLKSLVESVREISGSTFYKACSIAIKDIYGVDIDPPTEEAFIEASNLIREAYKSKYWTRRIFKESSLIDGVLWDPYWDIWGESFDPELFKPVFRINSLLFGYRRDVRDHNGNSPYVFEKYLNLKVETFEDYMNLVDKVLEEAKKRGYVALKSALAYDRPILFEEVEEDEARRVFNKRDLGLTSRDVKLFQDFIFHHILSKASELDFPIQFHTGLAIIEGSNPMNLVNVIRKYSNVDFILFHGGYPWIRETAAIAVSFRNVYIDFCWLPIISPSACRLLLREVIELGLSSRVMWGGDCWVAEATYGALKVFKSLISEVLCEMVDRGYLKLDEALEIAFRVLSENARRIFNI